MLISRIRNAAAARLLPTRLYVERTYRARVGEALNLDNPVKFNEKLQWLKLYYRDATLPRIVNKIEAKNVVQEKLGIDRSVPTAAIFDRPDQIQLSNLPSALALKATHGSGWNIISRDKSALDLEQVRSYFRFWLGKNYYTYSKEWAYKDVPPRVICEPLLINRAGDLPLDYKIFCFNGKPYFIQVDFDRFVNHTRAFYDVFWRKQPFSIGYPLSKKNVDRPKQLDEMLVLARKLSAGIPFLRVDQYLLDDEVYIGELTVYPGNGMERFTDEDWNRKLGDLFELPSDSLK